MKVTFSWKDVQSSSFATAIGEFGLYWVAKFLCTPHICLPYISHFCYRVLQHSSRMTSAFWPPIKHLDLLLFRTAQVQADSFLFFFTYFFLWRETQTKQGQREEHLALESTLWTNLQCNRWFYQFPSRRDGIGKWMKVATRCMLKSNITPLNTPKILAATDVLSTAWRRLIPTSRDDITHCRDSPWLWFLNLISFLVR